MSIDTTSFILDQFEIGNIDLTAFSALKDIHGGKEELGHALKTGRIAGRIVQIGASNTLAILGDKGGIFNDLSSLSTLTTTSAGMQFAAIAGPAGGVICTVSDLVTLYNRSCELHELGKQVKEVEKERPGSITHKFLHKKRELQRWLVASSVVAVAADGAVLTGTFMSTAGLGAGAGSTAVAAIRMLGEDHLNDTFKKDLTILANLFELHNPHITNDKDAEKFRANFHALKQRYEHAKAKQEKAGKALDAITKKIEQITTGPMAWGLDEVLEKLSHDHDEALKALEHADAALKKVEPGYKKQKAIHEDLESYKACKALILDLENLHAQRDHAKSEIQPFEAAYKKEYGESFELYKEKHFGDVNPAWQKRVDTLEQRLVARKNTFKEQLRQAEKELHVAEKRYDFIRSQLSSARQTLFNNDGSNRATGSHVNVKVWAQARAEIRLLEGDLAKASKDLDEEMTIVDSIKKTIEKTEAQQASLTKYVKNWQHLSEVREKIMVRHRGYDNQKAIASADEILEKEKNVSFRQLLSPENRKIFDEYQLQRKRESEAPPVAGNVELDKTNRHSKEPGVVNWHPYPIQTQFSKVEKPLTPTAKSASPSTERSSSERTKTPQECFDDLIGHISNTQFLSDDSQHTEAHEQLKYIKQNHPEHFEKMKIVVREDAASTHYLGNIDSFSGTYVHIDCLKKHIPAFKDLKTELQRKESVSVKVDSPESEESPSSFLEPEVLVQ
jgi:hypothetical protein